LFDSPFAPTFAKLLANPTFPWIYRAYGLRLKSEIQIPVFLPEHDQGVAGVGFWAQGETVTIQLETSQSIGQLIPDLVAQESIAVKLIEDGVILYLKDIAVFQIEKGETVRCYPAPHGDNSGLCLALSGIVMAVLLLQRGCFTIHASAVAMGGEGILFLGDSGAGKSSLAIALHQRGYPIVTDDLAGIIEREGKLYLLSAFPQMRVTPEASEALDLPWNQLIVLPNNPKRGFRFEAEFVPIAIPLGHIYVLKPSEDQETHCQPLQNHQKIMELMHHSEVMSLFGDNKIRHFQACSAMAEMTPIDYFQRPMTWAALPTALDSLEKHLALSQ
jgi:hypothetical protein